MDKRLRVYTLTLTRAAKALLNKQDRGWDMWDVTQLIAKKLVKPLPPNGPLE